MKTPAFLIIAIYILTACSGIKSIKTSDYSKSPKEVGKLVIKDLLSRLEFMMYKTQDVNAVHYAEACAGYGAIKLAAFLNCQTEDGMWRQLIDKEESFKETSSTAMFGYAITVGIKKGLLPKKPYRSAYIKAWNSLTKYINKDGKVSEVCVGTGQSKDVNFYLNRPRITGDLHGQAPILWFAYSLLFKN